MRVSCVSCVCLFVCVPVFEAFEADCVAWIPKPHPAATEHDIFSGTQPESCSLVFAA